MRLVILSSDARQHESDRQGVALAKSRAHGRARIDSHFPCYAAGKSAAGDFFQ
jgi:hypothetical protein